MTDTAGKVKVVSRHMGTFIGERSMLQLQLHGILPHATCATCAV